jgi:hypothetical protein
VIIRGSAESVLRAKEMVEKILEEDNAEREEKKQDKTERREGAVAGRSQGAGGKADAPEMKSPEWSFPKVPPGADPARAAELLQNSETKAKKRKNKKKKDSTASTGAPVNGHAHTDSASSLDLGMPAAPSLATAFDDVDGLASAAGASAPLSQQALPPPTATPTPTATASPVVDPALIRQVVKTEAASELLSLILGNGSALPGADLVGVGVGGGPGKAKKGKKKGAEPAAGTNGTADGGNYFKSASGLSVRL